MYRMVLHATARRTNTHRDIDAISEYRYHRFKGIMELDILFLIYLILWPLASNMREPFHGICVQIIQSLDS